MASEPTALAVAVTERDHVRGKFDAPLTLLEYGDYECPYCGRASPIVNELRVHLGDRLRLIFRHFPQNSVHPHASVAAQAAESAGAQGNFWEMHDLLFEHQDDLANADLDHYALRIGLEIYQFETDMSSGRFAKRVRDDAESGEDSGVKGTPTFFINDKRYTGPLDLGALKAALEDAWRTS
jgi:protein-disulfide isomerase